MPLPPATYEVNRVYRDIRRRCTEVRETVRVRRVTTSEMPANCRRFVAELPDGELVGELRAHERNTYLAYEVGSETEREMVLDGILVTFQYRRLGIGRRLVEALLDGMRADGIRTAYAIADGAGPDLLLACGFDLEPGRAWALRLGREG